MLWRKSSFSGNEANCVELAWLGARTAIRDSKNSPARLDVSAGAFGGMLVIAKKS